MALALYRKYRPATFAEVRGQEHVTEPLIQALGAGRINHAYLFSGPRGCGKTSSARILARSLNCERGPTPTPCGACESCRALAPDGPGSLDVIEIDAASHGGVDDARDLRERAFFAPVSSRYKVYIVDEAHMVSTQGFNALLKLVEEPPEFLIFIFATTEPDKVLPTIRSRTHHYPFRLLPPGVMRGLLEGICAAEGVVVEPAVFPLVVRAGGGSARDAQSVLDQLLAGAGPKGVTYSGAVGLLGVTDAALIDDMVDALGAADGAGVFQAVDRVVEAGHDPRRFAIDLLERLRDLVVLAVVPDAAGKGLIDGPADQTDRMVDQARRIGTSTLSRFADIVHGGLVEMRGTTSPRLLLELVCARMLLPAASAVDGLVQRVERLERRASIAGSGPTGPTGAPESEPESEPTAAGSAERAGARTARPTRPTDPDRPTGPARPAESGRPAPAARPARPAELAAPDGHSAPATQPTQPTQPTQSAQGAPDPAGPGVDAAGIRQAWPSVLDSVKGRRRTAHALLMNVTVTAVENDTLVLSVSSAPLSRLLSDEVNLDTVRTALREVLGVDWKVRCVVDAGADRAEVPGGTSARAGGGPPGGRADRPVPVVPAYQDDPRDEENFDPGPAEPAARQDPEEAAISLLRTTLGARPITQEH
ncbi:MAG TPA: DNA polymerase III subunit gamma and tau [Mycobacteriales bacterium]|nr:DNA polymerase III subunit gamma and tau [Mycobacteriales bacterium]